MLSLLRNYPGYAVVSAFKLRLPVLPLSYVGTRHFLTTSPDHSPAAQKAEVESKEKSAVQKKQDKPAKPKRFTKKELAPPSKRPMSSFAAFAKEYRAKELQDTDTTTSIPLADTLRDAAAVWTNMSAEEKQTYAPSREALEAYRLSLKDWQDSLSAEAMRALRIRRRREKGTGYALFLSETFKEAAGDTFGEKVAERAAVWKSFSDETKADYTKRAAETRFGVRVRREAQHDRQVEKETKKKVKAEERKAKEREKKKAEQLKQKKAELAKRKKAEQTKRKKAAPTQTKKVALK